VLSKLQYVLALSVCCLAIGCSRATPPPPIAGEQNPTQLTGKEKEAYEADMAVKAGDTSEEMVKKTAGVAGGKSQPNAGGGN
jgi:hypothetical protein